MAIARKFFDWRRPALGEAVRYLTDHYATGGRLDLSAVIVVLPGSRAARRLLEMLVDAAALEQLSFVPGDIITIGQLPEFLYTARRPLASELTQRAAWAKALQVVPRADLVNIVPFPPPSDESLAWLELGDLLRREHIELAGDGLNFSHVAATIADLDVPRDVDRWKSLAKVQDAYHQVLDALELWDRQTARLVAVAKQECHIDRDVVLLGTVDLNRTLRDMLDAIAERTTALIPAPLGRSASSDTRTPLDRKVRKHRGGKLGDRVRVTVEDSDERHSDLGDLFDSHGCLIPAQWKDWYVDLADEQLNLVERPPDQATQVAACLAAYGGEFGIEDITIGIPDEDPELIAQIERQLAERGVVARWGPGRAIAESLPYRLFAAVAEYLRTEARAAFAALVRHPDVYDWLTSRVAKSLPGGRDWLAQFDGYLATQFPQKIEPPWLTDEIATSAVPLVYDALRQLLAPLQGKARSLQHWNEPLRQVLLELYGPSTFDLHQSGPRASWRAIEAIDGALSGFDSVPTSLMPSVSAAEALSLVLNALGRDTIPSAVDEPAVELLGWLELPLDDAAALVVTSFNDGTVPKAVNSDPFLPNAIRARLGLDDNERRYARDAYALAVLQASRRRLDLIVGQRTSNGDPLSPSRLLLAGDDETILRRVRRLFRADSATPTQLAPPVTSAPSDRALVVPTRELIVAREPWLSHRPGVTEPLSELRVTQFKAYLACPYRFFLQQVLGLQSATDDVHELDPLAFGSLFHDILRNFGIADCCHSTNPEAIQAELSSQLDRLVAGRYGSQPLPAVRVQVEQIRLRLARFAQIQAQRVQQGWRIVHVEDEKRAMRANFDVDGTPITLIGRIDRIDQHAKTGAFAILDYKTSKAGDPPRKTHQRSKEWIDLQLPLYRYLARSASVEGTLELGYVLLPADAAKAGVAIADWSEAELVDADAVARQVVRELRRLTYGPRSTDLDADRDDFAGICQTGVMGARA